VVISIKNASFRLGEAVVFSGISWTFSRSQQWALVGANGSGKTLLADALRGRIPLVGGSLRYGFRAPHWIPPEECVVYLSFEDRKADVHDTVVQSRWNSIEEAGSLTVLDYLSYDRVLDVNPFEVTNLHERLRPAFNRRKGRAIALLGLRPFLQRSVLSLSSGESQRLQLARALCHPARLLILDEPYLSLDSAMRGHLEGILHRLSSHLPMIFITTRQEDVPSWVSHALLLEDCRLISSGPRAQVLRTATAGTPKFSPLPVTSRGRRSVVPESSARRPESPKSGTELVRLENVTVRYGEKMILNNFSWTVRAGEKWALLGPNGSGKTTLLSLIIGDNPQLYANRVFVFGRARGTGESIWEIKRRIGWVSPELHFYFVGELTCLEVVESGFEDIVGPPRQVSSRNRSVARQWLKGLGLLPFAGSPYLALSAGLQRMTLLARALVKRPPLLILDEPCQGLDRLHRETFLQALNEFLRGNSVTVICVAHRLDELPSTITRVLRLSRLRSRKQLPRSKS
jgi:molybdate transport system ATP-binding protein